MMSLGIDITDADFLHFNLALAVVDLSLAEPASGNLLTSGDADDEFSREQGREDLISDSQPCSVLTTGISRSDVVTGISKSELAELRSELSLFIFSNGLLSGTGETTTTIKQAIQATIRWIHHCGLG